MIKKLFIIVALGLYCRASSAMENTKAHEEDSVKQCKESLERIIERLESREKLQQEAKARKAREKEENLFCALYHGDFEKFNALLKEGVSTESLIKEPMYFWTRWKSGGGDYAKQLKILLDLGADPNKEREDEGTPLQGAISCGNFNVVKVLLANPKTQITDDPNNNITLMMHAAMHCYHSGDDYTAEQRECSHKKIVKLLLFFGCDATRKRLSGNGAVDDALNRYRSDIAGIIADYKDIHKHCSSEELQEFGAIKAARMGATHAAIMRRQITGTFGAAPKLCFAKKKSPQKETAAAPAASTASASAKATSDKTAAAGTQAETSKK
jgi:hypothetical protein